MSRSGPLSALLVPVIRRIATRAARGVAQLYLQQVSRDLVVQLDDGTEHNLTQIGRTGTTKGDLAIYTGLRWRRLAVGTNGQILVADSGQNTGIKWAATSTAISFIEPLNSFSYIEDFVGDSTEDGEIGQLGWRFATIGGGTNSYQPASSMGTVGIHRIQGNGTGSAASPRARLLYLQTDAFYGRPAVGTYCALKMRLVDTTAMTVYGGLSSSTTLIPDLGSAAHSLQFIGLRCGSEAGTVGNWFLVVRTGTTETAVDLGVAASTAWFVGGWRATSTGIQGLVYNASSDTWTDTGTEVAYTSSSMPSTSALMGSVVGCATHGVNNKAAEIDTYALYNSAVDRTA